MKLFEDFLAPEYNHEASGGGQRSHELATSYEAVPYGGAL